MTFCSIQIFSVHMLFFTALTSLFLLFFSYRSSPRVGQDFLSFLVIFIRVSLDLITIYERDSADLRDRANRWVTERQRRWWRCRGTAFPRPLFLPESRNRRAPFVEAFLFRPPWSRSLAPVPRNHDPLRVIEDDH